MTIKCEDVSLSLADYLHDRMFACEVAEFEQHLDTCAHCTAALMDLADAPLTEEGPELAVLVDEYVVAMPRPHPKHDPTPAAFTSAGTTNPRSGDRRDRHALNGKPGLAVPRAVALAGSSPGPNVLNWRLRLIQGVAAGLAACLLVGFVSHFLTPSPVLASGEPDPWHALRGTSRAALVRQLPAFFALNEMCEPRPWPAVIDERVGEIADPDYSGLEVLRDSKVFDLSGWVPVAPDKVHEKRISPVHMTRVQLLRRLPGHAANSRIRYKYWTEGFCVDPRKTRASDIIREGTRDHRAERICKVWELEIDVSDRPEGEVFTLVTSAIFWNGFPDKPEQWAATAVGSPSIARAELGIILPRDRTVKSWSLWKYPSGKQQAQPENRLKAGAPPREAAGILYWPIAQIDVGHTYEIRWTW